MQNLHMVVGGQVTDPQTLEFSDLQHLDVVGFYGSYAEALEAWRASAQRTVDDAETRYTILHVHRLLETPGLSPSR